MDKAAKPLILQSGRPDLNRGPSAPKTDALASLRYAPPLRTTSRSHCVRLREHYHRGSKAAMVFSALLWRLEQSELSLC